MLVDIKLKALKTCD